MSRQPLPIGSLVAWSAVVVSSVVVAWSLPIDDFWLTLASGQAITGGADPRAALPFSWTDEAPGALNPQWGAQLILGAPGSLGVALAINAGLIGIGLAVTVARSRLRASAVATAAALLITLAALAPHLLARAQSFSIALLPVALLLLERFRTRAWLPIAYGLLVAAWANLHGAFVIGQVAAVAWLVAALVRREPVAIPALVVLAAAVAPLLNPVGPALLAYAYGQPASDVVTAISVEWQPAWPWVTVAAPFWAILALLIAGRAIRRPGAPLMDVLLLTGLAALAIGGIRHIPWFLLAAAPVLSSDVDQAIAASPRLRRAIGSAPGLLTGRRARVTLTVIALVAVAFELIRPALPASIARLTPDEPAAVVERLKNEAQPGDRVLNEQVWGGYLAYRLWPRVETAMDGRLEIRSRDEWAAYFALMQGRDDPAAVLAAENVEWALISTDRTALRDALEAAGWRVLADDGYAVLLRSPSAES